jgi:hypothetical protein
MDALLYDVAAAIIIRVVVVEIVIVRPEPEPEPTGKESTVMEAMAEAVTESGIEATIKSWIERAGCKAVSLKRGKAVRLRPGNSDAGWTNCGRARKAVAEITATNGARAKIPSEASTYCGATAETTATAPATYRRMAAAETTTAMATAETTAAAKPTSATVATASSTTVAGRQSDSRREQAD